MQEKETFRNRLEMNKTSRGFSYSAKVYGSSNEQIEEGMKDLLERAERIVALNGG